MFWRKSSLRMTLNSYYKKKRHFWAEEFPDFHDAFLNNNFIVRDEANNKLPKAIDLIRKNRRHILNSVSKYSGERKYVINDLLKDIQKRSKELNLGVAEDEQVVILYMTSYVASLIMNYQYTGRFRGEKKRRKK